MEKSIYDPENTFDLSCDLLGYKAFLTFFYALKPIKLLHIEDGKQTYPASKNIQIIDGNLKIERNTEEKDDKEKKAVRLYIFDIVDECGETQREAILIFNGIPKNLKASTLPQFFKDPDNLTGYTGLAWETLEFADDYLIISSLDYSKDIDSEVTGQKTFFPPLDAKNITLPDKVNADSLKDLLPELRSGYGFKAHIKLPEKIKIPDEDQSFELKTILGWIGLNEIFDKKIEANAYINIEEDNADFWLYPKIIIPPLIINDHLKLKIDKVGLRIRLNIGKYQLPEIELIGKIFGVQTHLYFDPQFKLGSVKFRQFPSFGDIESTLGIKNAIDDKLPDFVSKTLNAFTITRLDFSFDYHSSINISSAYLAIATPTPVKIFDGVDVYLRFDAQISNPFDKNKRQYSLSTHGIWHVGDAKFDVGFSYEDNGTNGEKTYLSAELAIGHSIDFIALTEKVFHADVKGLPTLNLEDAELFATRNTDKSGKLISESLSLELSVASGWAMGNLDIELDNLTLDIGFSKDGTTQKWTLDEASAEGELEIGNLYFRLQAYYDNEDESWVFSGSTGGKQNKIFLDKFISEFLKAIGIQADHEGMLDPFNNLTIEACQIEYHSKGNSSPTWHLYIAVKEKTITDQSFGVSINKIIIRMGQDGEAFHFAFDALCEENQQITGLTKHVSTLNDHGSIELPEVLNTVQLTGFSATYNSFLKNYSFIAYFHFKDNAFIQLHIDLLGKGNYDIGGKLIFNPDGKERLDFDLEIVGTKDVENKQTALIASYKANSTKAASLATLVKAISDEPSSNSSEAKSSESSPPDFGIGVQQALFAYGSSTQTSKPKSLSASSQNSEGKVKQTKYLFAVDIGAGVNLSSLGNLPLVGGVLHDLGELKLAFQFAYGTAGYTKKEIDTINTSLGEGHLHLPVPEKKNEAKGIIESLAIQLRQGDHKLLDTTLSLGIDKFKPKDTGQTNKKSMLLSASPDSQKPSKLHWYPLDKKFGPLHLKRVGLGLDTKKEMIIKSAMDGGISLAGLDFDLYGLGVDVPINGEKKFEPTFNLRGLSLGYEKGSISILGALMKSVSDGQTAYNGLAVVGTKKLQLSAIGSFAELANGDKSLFVYAVLGIPIGGDPSFYITGLAAGFGYNRKLKLPDVADVKAFPLIQSAISPGELPKSDDIETYVNEQIGKLSEYIPPESKQYFLTVGIKFTTYKLINGFLLVAVQFGNDFELDLLGVGETSMPPKIADGADIQPLAQLTLNIKGRFAPAEGLVTIQGQLNKDSFIFSKDCHLTGGFAMSAWFLGEHEGDFVITIGGYSPYLSVPSHYPTVPRVGFNWQVSNNLFVKGGGYFALTPQALMAGGALEASWHNDYLKAHFLLVANFLIKWKPFHYQADLSVDIHAEGHFHKVISIHKSFDAHASLNVWGPDFGGHAYVKCKVIGIKIEIHVDFGSYPSSPPALTWGEFSKSFLPAKDKWLGIQIQEGLIKTVKNDDGNEIWIVKRDELTIMATTVLPVKKINSNSSLPDFGIKPMELSTINDSNLQINIKKEGGDQENSHTIDPIINLVFKNSPAALWGKPSDSTGEKSTVKTALGCIINFGGAQLSEGTEPISLEKLLADPEYVDNEQAWCLNKLKRSTNIDNLTNDNSIKKRQEVMSALDLSHFKEKIAQPFDYA